MQNQLFKKQLHCLSLTVKSGPLRTTRTKRWCGEWWKWVRHPCYRQSRETRRQRQRKWKPTCSSAKKSALYWAMSSGGLFWTRLRHSSQMAKPTMNMPMSGMKTRMPFPASAPITLWGEREQTLVSCNVKMNRLWRWKMGRRAASLTVHEHC